ncbi:MULTISPECIES: hypothetical protein [Streptomyces]|uniref:SCO7613 C-terminal domain-containing membrane protein n=1 Tax=Streptomyces TaxID=1883 RepID=UPI0018E01B20|nr:MULTISPECIES: hypothetical protein [Streptomyces]
MPVPVCPRCALPLTGEIAAELRAVGTALAAVDAERGRLLGRRAQLLAAARPVAYPPPPPGWGPRPGPAAGPFAVPFARPVAGPVRETSPPSAQNLLLSLGGALLAVAVTAFTVVNWGQLGIGGRSAVLGALTLTALAVPALLLRRALSATAEVIACLGLVLLLLDAYAVRRVSAELGEIHALVYTAGCLAVVSALWAGYGLLLRGRLVLPAPVALVLAQLPLPLWAWAHSSVRGFAAAVLLAAASDAALAVTAPGRRLPRGLRTTGAVAGTVSGLLGLAAALWLSLDAASTGAALQACGLLLAGAAVALTAAHRLPAAAPVHPVPVAGTPPLSAPVTRHPAAALLAALAALVTIAGTGGVVRTWVADDWVVPGYLGCAVAVLALAAALRGGSRGATADGVATGASAAHLLAALWAVPALAVTCFGPLSWVGSIWSGAPHSAHDALTPHGLRVAPPSMVVVAGLLALVLTATALRRPAWRVPGPAAVVCGAVTVAALPAAAGATYPVALSLRLALAVALLAAAVAVRVPLLSRTALIAGTATAVTAVAWGLAGRTATFAVLGVLLAAFAGTAAVRGDIVRRTVGAVGTVACATGPAWAGPAAAGHPSQVAAFLVLAVGATAVLSAAPSGWPRQALESAGWVAAALAVVLAVPDAPALALVLAAAGVLAAALALRQDRRQAVYAAGALTAAASWVRLAASGVTTPEAYTLSLTAAGLLVGWLRRRRDPAASSWSSYGPGLAATLLPSLVAAWGDAHWQRPLLLGAGALAVTLLGARHRLRAPLLLGGAVLVLLALHELAPYVVQVVGAAPRWLPLAVAGLLLLALGTTYERRLRDVRRVREVIGRMR